MRKLPMIGSALLGAGLALNSLLGPLVLDRMRFHVSPAAITQLLGGEVVSLFAAAPLALIAAALAYRRHALWPVLALGPALYSIYMNVQMVAANEFTRYAGNSEFFFPLHLALVVLGWVVALVSWSELKRLPQPRIAPRLEFLLGAFMIAIGALFLVAWSASIADIYRGHVSQWYRDDVMLFWLVRLMDLSTVIPAGLAIGYGLLRHRAWAIRPALALVGVQTLLSAAVAGMSIMMAIRADPASNTILLVSTILFTSAFAASYVAISQPLARKGAA